jgi:hypothetical protein
MILYVWVKLPKNNYLKYDKINQSIIEKCNFMIWNHKEILNSKSIGLALSGGGSRVWHMLAC